MTELESHYGKLLGLPPEWKVVEVDLSLEAMRVEIRLEWAGGNQISCPECGEACRIYDLREERSWRHLDAMQFQTLIRCRVPRCECPEHGVKTAKVPWAGKNSRFTLMFEAFAIRVLQACSTVEGARRLLGLSWKQVDEIRTRAVERGMARREAEKIEYIGLDEKSFGKGHDYVSVLTDLKGRRVLEVRENRDEANARTLLQTLSKEQRKEVLAAAIDMWPAYMNAVQGELPEAVMVHDKFHVSKHLNESVDKVRKQENRRLEQRKDHRLKGTKYLWLKGFEKLSEDARERFRELKQSGLQVGRAWAIKDAFQEFWTFEFGCDAQAFFKQWYGWAARSRLKPVKRVADMLKKHLEGLLGHVIHPITNAATEGFNSKIQNIKASARGFRRFEKYRIAILFYCGKLDLAPDLPQFS